MAGWTRHSLTINNGISNSNHHLPCGLFGQNGDGDAEEELFRKAA